MTLPPNMWRFRPEEYLVLVVGLVFLGLELNSTHDFTLQVWLFVEGAPIFLAMVLGYCVYSLLQSRKEHGDDAQAVQDLKKNALAFARDWIPLLLLLAAYENALSLVDRINPELYDRQLFKLDHMLLGFNPGIVAAKHIRGWFGELTAICYSLLYLWPIIVGGVLYFQKRHLAFRNFLSSFVLAGYIGYVGYCLVPVVGPVFYYGPSHLHETENSEQSSNLEALGGDSESGLFVDLTYQFNTVRSGSKAPRNCFPSLHTAWGVILLATLWMSLRKLFWVCLWPIALMILATVSLRLHYFVDVVAGLLVAILALSLMPRINAWWQKHSPDKQDSKALTDAEKPGPAWRLWLSLLSTLVFCGGVTAYLHSPLAEVPSLEAQEQDFLASRFLNSVPKEARGQAIPLANRARLVGISYAPRALNPRDSLRIKLYFQSPQKVTHEMQIKYVISQGKKVFLTDLHRALRGLKSALDWPTDKVTLDDHFLRIPNGIAPGNYLLSLTIYAPDGGALSPVIPVGPIVVK